MRSIGRDNRFLVLFALANAGGVIAYVPLLTLLLPAKVAALAPGTHVAWLAAATLAGAAAAGVGNIAFGWASDVVGTRRGWAAGGLVLTLASYALVHVAASPATVVAAVAIYQFALNMLLAPLAAWAADTVPDGRKGLLGGLLAAGPLAGALAGVIATLPAFPQDWMRLAAVCALILAFTAPLLLTPFPHTERSRAHDAAVPRRVRMRTGFALLWASRLIVQVAGNLLFGFLLYYFSTVQDAPSQAGVARLSASALLFAFPLALVCGRLSDREGRQKPFLVAAALATAAGLGLMAWATTLLASAVGYILFACANVFFLALHAGFAMRLLPSPMRRGRDLGILNLTNTLPAMIAPLLAVWLVPGRGFGPLLAMLAGSMLVAAVLVSLVRSPAQAA